jgi:phosphomannomutase
VANNHLKVFGMIPGVAVIGGFIVTSLLSVFVLQSGINGSHQSTLSQTLAEEIAQQVNIKETQLIEQLGKIASSALATNTITGSIADLLANFPTSVATPEIHVAVKDSEKFSLIETLVETADFKDATLTTIDGLRVDFADGWGLVRASNTEPALTLRFEADSDESLENIKSAFRELLQEVKSDLNFE